MTPVGGRVAPAGGQPPAANGEATVRSLARRFRLPHGEEERTGVNTIPVFPVRTPEEAGNCRDIDFDPLVLPDGIGPSDDPLLRARPAAYSRSFTRRAGEAKTPSAAVAATAQGAGL